jgi:acyl carrier protein
MQSKSEVVGGFHREAKQNGIYPEGNQIEERIREFVASNLLFSENGFPYQNSDSFLRHSVVDSLGVVELVAFVQRQFQVTVNPAEVTPENFDSVNQLAAFVRRKIQCSKEAPYAGS